MNEHKQLAIKALSQMKGDNLARARFAFRNKTPEQMQEEYGLSGQTCAEIVAEYEEYEAKVDAAIAWVEAQGRITNLNKGANHEIRNL